MKVFRGVAVSMIDQRRLVGGGFLVFCLPFGVCGCGFLLLLLDLREDPRTSVLRRAAVFVVLVIHRDATLADFAVTAILSHSMLLSNICAIPLVADL